MTENFLRDTPVVTDRWACACCSLTETRRHLGTFYNPLPGSPSWPWTTDVWWEGIAPMSENFLRDTPVVTRPYCPTCEEDVDHAVDELLEIRYCSLHLPPSTGAADAELPESMRESYPAGSGEVTGKDNKAWCDFFHRQRRD
jgi:hypothetical protein